MTVEPTVTAQAVKVQRLRVQLADGLLARVRAAVTANTEGLRDTLAAVTGNLRVVPQNADGTWPTIDRKPWLAYAWWANVDPLAAEPTTENGAQPGDLFNGRAESFLGGGTVTTPETRAALFLEDFAGALDGGPWPTSRWSAGLAGGSATVSAERGRLTSGTTGGYALKDATSVRGKTTPLRDLEVVLDVTLLGTGTECELRLTARNGEPDANMANGVVFAVTRDGVNVSVANSWAFKRVKTTAKTHAAGTVYRARFVVASQTSGATLLRCRTWDAAGAEPSTWDLDVATVEPGADSAGRSWDLEAPGIAEAGIANTVAVDNVRVYDRPAASAPEWWGTWVGRTA